MTLPVLKMTGWSIDDFELCLDGLRMVGTATAALQNQPRATSKGDYLPGAQFIVDLGEGWCSDQIDAVIKRLETIRFGDAEADERRVLLLISYYSSHGRASEPLDRIITMAREQAAPAA